MNIVDQSCKTGTTSAEFIPGRRSEEFEELYPVEETEPPDHQQFSHGLCHRALCQGTALPTAAS
jgi:hypothetical protein